MDGFTDATDLMRGICGVYILYLDTVPVYVGQSRQVEVRIKEHVRAKKFKFNRVVVKRCQTWELDGLEHHTILVVKPTQNSFDRGMPDYPRIDLEALGMRLRELPKRPVSLRR